MGMMATLKDARRYLNELPRELDEYLDDDYRRGLENLLHRFDEFFRIVASVNIRAAEERMIEPDEATEIGDYGFVLLLKLVDLMERLDQPHRRQEVEQISLVLANWVVSYRGTINHLEPVVNAIAQLSNLTRDKQVLLTLSELIGDIVDHCSPTLRQDSDADEPMRAWRLLHINRSIVATRSQDPDTMRRAFDEFLIYLPNEAPDFFAEGMREMDSMDYPQHVRQVMEQYFRRRPSVNLH